MLDDGVKVLVHLKIEAQARPHVGEVEGVAPLRVLPRTVEMIPDLLANAHLARELEGKLSLRIPQVTGRGFAAFLRGCAAVLLLLLQGLELLLDLEQLALHPSDLAPVVLIPGERIGDANG
jgi:hypothetical protein